jgi:hypothetical protein
LKQPAFNPLNSQELPPDQCGYGLRVMYLNKNLSKIEMKLQNKPGVDFAIPVDQIMRPLLPQITSEIIKSQKRFMALTSLNQDLIVELQSSTGLNTNLLQGKFGTSSMNIGQLVNCSYYPFCLITEKGGRIELVAPDYETLQEWVSGLNVLLKNKKILPTLRQKIETYTI